MTKIKSYYKKPNFTLYQADTLEFQNRKGQKIVGVIEKPDGEIKGTCVVQHGWGGNKERPTAQAIKNAFLESGFQTFNFDTTNSFGESDGNYEKSTLGLHWEDLEDVVKWVQKQDWYKGPLALTGHSMGGYAVARYAEEYPDEVSYLVPVAPVVSGKLTTEAHLHHDAEEFKKWEQNGVLITESSSIPGLIKKSPWKVMVEWQNHNLLLNASKIKMPTLLIVGSEDQNCPVEHIRKLFNAMPNGSKKMVVLAGAPHSYHRKSEQENCAEVIKSWLKKL